MKNRNDLMLLRIAQADAYCMAVEYVPYGSPSFVEAKKYEAYCLHPVHKLGAGMYTDDTQMSIAVTEQLLSTEPPTALSFASHFMTAFLRDPRDGYSRSFQRILEKSKTGQDLIDNLIPTSTKNGAAMRSVPLGVIPNLYDMLLTATMQAKVTHDSEEGVVSSCAIAFLSHWALYTDSSFEECCALMAELWPQFSPAFLTDWRGPVADRSAVQAWINAGAAYDVGVNTVWAVCTLLRQQTTLMGILDQVIEWGGDTDSVAAIAWGIASTRIRDDVPQFLFTQLEPGGQFGSKYLLELGTSLMEKFDVKGKA